MGGGRRWERNWGKRETRWGKGKVLKIHGFILKGCGAKKGKRREIEKGPNGLQNERKRRFGRELGESKKKGKEDSGKGESKGEAKEVEKGGEKKKRRGWKREDQ